MRHSLRFARALAARALAALLFLGLVAGTARAQPGTWQAYPAFGELSALAASPEALWAGGPGGLFAYRPAARDFERFTATDGLHGGALSALGYDAARRLVWAGFADGVLNRVDERTGEIRAVFDVSRAMQYSDRGINRIVLQGDSLLLATAFGLVVYDPVRGEVRNTYARLASLEAGTAVLDALVAPLPDGRAGLWLATAGGVVRAPLAAPSLQLPSAWTREAGFAGPATALAFFEGRVHAGGGPAGLRGVYRRQAGGAWQLVLPGDHEIRHLAVADARLIATSPFYVFRLQAGARQGFYVSAEAADLRAALPGPDGRLWAADGGAGLFPLPPPEPADAEQPFTVEPAVPSGPFASELSGVAVAPGGAVGVVTGRPARPNGFSHLDGGAWRTFSNAGPQPALPPGRFDFVTADAAGRFYAGSDGGGLVAVDPDGTATTYSLGNSTLRSSAGPSFVVVRGLATDDAGRRWVTNYLSDRPLHLWAADGSWTGLPAPPGYPIGGPAERLVVDRFGQKWITIERRGVLVWDTGANPASSADDRVRFFGQVGPTGQGLPNSEVRALALDAQGRLWIGTARGLATVFSPGSAFGADPALATPQWPRTADGTAFLLRDANVNDFALDPAGRLWVATTSGAYLLNAEGTAVVTHFTAANSPLPTDVVRSVAVDAGSGRVYFATERGLLAFTGDATGPDPQSAALRVAPAPFRPAQHAAGVLVSGLRAARSSVRILTLDGEVVYAADVAGGSFRWDGRDGRSGEPVRSGVYIVAAAGADGEGTVYGRIAVIR
ncbi:MAG: two-component regulator propeller domain-containing protein [Rubricoccaceae bacterium]